MKKSKSRKKKPVLVFKGPLVSGWGFEADRNQPGIFYYLETAPGVRIPVSREAFEAVDKIRARNEKVRLEFTVTGEKR